MRRHAKVLAAVSILASFLACAASASAADFRLTGTFSGLGSGNGQLSALPAPGRAAVERSAGNLFVVDTGNNRVQVFKINLTGSADYLTQFGGGELSSPWGIAIDQNAGQTYVYVADAANNRIVKYDSDEEATPSFTLDASFPSPTLGNYKAALAIDPTTHDLLIANYADKEIKRFKADGTPDGSFDGSAGAGSPGVFSGPIDLAVNSSGDVYVIDANGPNIEQQEGTSQALRYSAAGQYKATLSPVGPNQRPATVAVNLANDSVVVSGEQDAILGTGGGPTVHLFGATNNPLPFPAIDMSYGAISGLATFGPDGPVFVVLYPGLYEGQPYSGVPHVRTYYVDAAPPQATLLPADNLAPTSATLHGEANAEGHAAACRFEYSTDTSFDHSAPCVPGPVTGSAPVAVHADIEGLEVGGTYNFRLVVQNIGGAATTSVRTFTSAHAPPSVRVLPGSGRTTSGARLNAMVNPNNAPTTYRIEYGTDTSYGNSIPATSPNIYAGRGGASTRYSRPVSGLPAGTAIHYRVVASNAYGTTASADQTVVTLSEEVAYEMVSPPNKQGANLYFTIGVQASLSGDRAQYISAGVFAGAASGLQLNPYFSRRSSSNWQTKGVALPQANVNGEVVFGSTQGYSPDLSRSFSFSKKALLPGAVAGESNMYVQNFDTGDLDFVGTLPDQGMGISDAGFFSGSSTDGSHMVFMSKTALTADAIPDALSLYDYTNGNLELVSANASGLGGGKDRRKYNTVSEDGSHIFFNHGGALYVRVDGGEPILVSASKRPEDDPTEPHSIIYSWAAGDGSTVYFTTTDTLTTDAPPKSSQDFNYTRLYRYEVDSGDLTYIPPGEQLDETYAQIGGVSRDGSTVYFSDGNFLGEATRVYIAKDGAPHLIDGVSSAYSVTPNGRYAAVKPLDCSANDCSQTYVYDAVKDSFRCATCNPTGAPTSTPVYQEAQENTGGYVIRNLLDNGDLLFNSPDRLLPEDTNDQFDIYRWNAGQLDLVSSGTSPENTFYGDVTPDGRSVFFFTAQHLVGQDVDQAQDLYVARTGGGLSAQNPPPREAPCFGEGCLGPTPQPPGEVSPGSNGFNGPRNAKATSKQRKKCGKGRQLKKAHGRSTCVTKRPAAKGKRAGK